MFAKRTGQNSNRGTMLPARQNLGVLSSPLEARRSAYLVSTFFRASRQRLFLVSSVCKIRGKCVGEIRADSFLASRPCVEATTSEGKTLVAHGGKPKRAGRRGSTVGQHGEASFWRETALKTVVVSFCFGFKTTKKGAPSKQDNPNVGQLGLIGKNASPGDFLPGQL